ncbi:17920_t:CDS:2 [Funneliformis caledonium]|uniref:17920_t:CDS:1 n=1 Tax=Funneliformis caledonium TaxID=1117310 RepID=A0A9N9I323_9GLOM|nr:17920_t:CDS:2 [Funneliformis caledonium]
MSNNFTNLFDTFDTFTSPSIPVNLIVRKIEKLSYNKLDLEFKDINIIHDIKSNTFFKLTRVEICGENIGKNLFGDDYRMIYPKLLLRILNTQNIDEYPIIVGSCLLPILEKDLDKAIYWYKKAARNRCEEVQENLDLLLIQSSK